MHAPLLYSFTSDRYLHLFGNLALALSNEHQPARVSKHFGSNAWLLENDCFQILYGASISPMNFKQKQKKTLSDRRTKEKKKKDLGRPLNPLHTFNPTLALFRACWITERVQLKNVRHQALQAIHTNHFGREIYPRIWNTSLI